MEILEISFGEISSNEDNNITGEINASLKAIEEAFYRGVKVLNIYHDLEHLGAWYRGEYSTNNQTAKIFLSKAKYITQKSGMELNFIKVNAHSNISANERADFLAKMGCGGI